MLTSHSDPKPPYLLVTHNLIVSPDVIVTPLSEHSEKSIEIELGESHTDQDVVANEKADREAAEQNEAEERLAKEKGDREEAERIAKEKADREEAERLAKEKLIAKRPRVPRKKSEPEKSALNLSGVDPARKAPFAEPSLRRYALVFFGRCSKFYAWKNRFSGKDRAQRNSQIFTPLNTTSLMVHRHVIDSNGGADAFDLYIHSWSPGIENNMKEFIVRPHAPPGRRMNLVWSEFEDNDIYQRLYGKLYNDKANWAHPSVAISISKSAMSVLQHIKLKRRGKPYDQVLFMRPDLALIADINLSDPRHAPKKGTIYSDSTITMGDFYFIMSHPEDLERFADVRNQMDTKDRGYNWLPAAVAATGLRPEPGALKAGVDIEVYRKMCAAEGMWSRGFRFFNHSYKMTW
eukprot:CAMPEP_0170199090 /NCGR_PEP_ID=MMETSP0040_2-20121228/69146_1 /TAXON_ID=641309 /ORGANISM="Lotharella oceanica, Strain CCMP622" /LENGTH=404 /DNA_ID=CAMNT_0010449175 /DNA_START=1412 /DNA_END=2623 /DNA_ORIENTATION=+